LDLKKYTKALNNPEDKEKTGFLCPYTVEELIDAGGMVPVRIIPETPEVDFADAYLPSNLCSYLRYMVDMAMKGRLEGYRCIVISHSCDGARRVFDVLKKHLRDAEIHFLDVPKKTGVQSIAYFKNQLKSLKEFVEGVAGHEIPTDALAESVKKYNLNRELLARLYSLRIKQPVLFASGFMGELLKANTSHPKNEINVMLKTVIDEITDQPSKKPTSHESGKRVYVSGNMVDNTALLQFIEEGGGLVVGDDLCFGGRYYRPMVEDGPDLLGSLAQRYLSRVPCGRMENYRERFDHILQEVKECRADGLIYSSLKFCDNFLVDYPQLKEMLDGEGIPSLFLESEYFPMGTGQLRTRIEGFLETFE
jgi:benzoyl-CoA reductase/2-hydroxyglutaryl-CoA dehydratase subunit BcrC/BadD/HgdB